MCVCVCVCVCERERERERECVCVCVCERMQARTLFVFEKKFIWCCAFELKTKSKLALGKITTKNQMQLF